jgi:hypothetical protein
MSVPIGPPPDPRAGRQRALVAMLRVSVALVAILAVGALLLPEEQARPVGTAMVVTLVAVPVVRVGWLVIRWLRRGDLRFALCGVGLLVLMAGALLVSH